MSSEDVVIDVRHLSKRYEIYATPRDRLKQLVLPRLHRTSRSLLAPIGVRPRPTPQYFREFWALKDVSFQVRRGETFGIIGRNGSGKSTLLQLLAGVLAPTHGEAVTTGRVAALLELGSGFDPELSGHDNVFLNGRVLGLRQREIQDRYARIVEFADIGEFIDEPVKTYSSGMFLRLAFAVQAHIDASIVIIDEALAVGDVFFRQKCYARLEQLKQSGAAILLVSHSMPDIEQHCERALLLDHGSGYFLGTSSEASKHYYQLHQADQLRQLRHVDTARTADVTLPVGAGITRPPRSAFIDLSRKRQVGIDGVRCIAAALTDESGQARSSFQQRERASFYVEYEIDGPAGVPIGGIILKNDRGVIVHGKNAWQFDGGLPFCDGSAQRVTCRHEVTLDLAQGEYVFEFGLALVTEAQWSRRAQTSHAEMSSLYVTACQIADVGVFSVGLQVRGGIAVLTHHGVADLPGRIDTQVESIDATESGAHAVRQPEETL